MFDKRGVKRSLYRLEQIKTWQLIVLLVLMMFVSATFLRMNNIGMLQRREAVIAADKAGDDHAIQNRLVDLQAYALKHMNASTGDVYLVEKYNRDVEKAAEAARSRDTGGSTIYRQADEYCRSILSGYSQNYVQCVYERIDQSPGVADPVEVRLPDAALYKHNFASQGWVPDFAGWSVVITIIIGLLIVIRAITYAFLRLMLRRRYQRS